MAAIESPQARGLRPFTELSAADGVWPRGDRPDAIRDAAADFRRRFKPQGPALAARTVDLVSAIYPTRFALAGAATSLNPYVMLVNRLVVVQFEDFAGQVRTLAWEPTVAEASAAAPFYAGLIQRYGERVAGTLGSTRHHSPAQALSLLGLEPADVDLVAFDHLHVQDMRTVLGTVAPVGQEAEPRPPLFPRAAVLCQRRELDTLRSVHPLQWPWYVPGSLQDVREDRLLVLDGDVELGVGVALVSTPGHTDGNQTLCLNGPDGVWVSSENGVCADSWHPQLSKIPGVRRHAEQWRREVILNSNTLEDSLDQYDSMLKEKALADAHRADPRWLNILPSSELASLRRQWPVVPTFAYGGIDFGRLSAARAG